MFSRLLEEQAERCIRLAYECQNKNAERFLRLLAVDLMLAAQMQRPAPQNAALENMAQNATQNLTDELAELGRLSRQANPALKPGSAWRA